MYLQETIKRILQLLILETTRYHYINSTPNGGEYSPVKIPNSEDVSAVRLDNDGKAAFIPL